MTSSRTGPSLGLVPLLFLLLVFQFHPGYHHYLWFHLFFLYICLRIYCLFSPQNRKLREDPDFICEHFAGLKKMLNTLNKWTTKHKNTRAHRHGSAHSCAPAFSHHCLASSSRVMSGSPLGAHVFSVSSLTTPPSRCLSSSPLTPAQPSAHRGALPCHSPFISLYLLFYTWTKSI